MGIVREHYIFRGNVQGVGFRYTAKYAARAYGLTGWVKNCYDGSVEMELQGEQELIGNVLKEIYGGSYIQINDIERKRLPLEADERQFKVRF
ncbi:acylphosphatase [Eubacterium ruminantium]|nr:acylphosphatase [Eubacterium ruminantium]